MTWKPGESGNPKGKRTGARDKITQAFLNKLDEVWREQGLEALKKAAQDRPAEFCRMIASLLPKDQNLSVKNDPAGEAHLAALFSMNRAPALEEEIARLKAENAALKGETPEDGPETIEDASAVH